LGTPYFSISYKISWAVRPNLRSFYVIFPPIRGYSENWKPLRKKELSGSFALPHLALNTRDCTRSHPNSTHHRFSEFKIAPCNVDTRINSEVGKKSVINIFISPGMSNRIKTHNISPILERNIGNQHALFSHASNVESTSFQIQCAISW